MISKIELERVCECSMIDFRLFNIRYYPSFPDVMTSITYGKTLPKLPTAIPPNA